MMMPRKSFLFGLALTMVMAVLVFASVEAKPKKNPDDRPAGPPTLSLAAEPTMVRACDNARVQLVATASSPSGLPLHYKWKPNGGTLSGQGANPTWDLSGLPKGVYQAVVEVDDGNTNCVAFSSASIVVTDCPPPPPRISCPNVTVSVPDVARENAPVTFTATIGRSANITPSYHWTVSAGSIITGQGTPSITVDTTGLAGQTVRADLDLGGYGIPCPASGQTSIPIEKCNPREFDRYYNIARNDEKARLDNYAIQLQNEPGSQGYIIVYPRRGARADAVQARENRISDYLVNSRGIDTSRFTITRGLAGEDWLFELWIVARGCAPPVPRR